MKMTLFAVVGIVAAISFGCGRDTKYVYQTSPIVPGSYTAMIQENFESSGQPQEVTQPFDVAIVQQGDAVTLAGMLGIVTPIGVVIDNHVTFYPDAFWGVWLDVQYTGVATMTTSTFTISTNYMQNDGTVLAGPNVVKYKMYGLCGPVSLPDHSCGTDHPQMLHFNNQPVRDLSPPSLIQTYENH